MSIATATTDRGTGNAASRSSSASKNAHRAARELRIEQEIITPEIAAAYLEKNVKNRKVGGRLVEQYARDIQEGRWRLTGEMIKFDYNGNLIDGQHRLMGCVKAGESFETFVAYGLEPEDQDVLDTGRGRSAADMLTLHGVGPSAHAAAVARLIMALKADISLGTFRASNSEVLEIIKTRPQIIRSIGMCWKAPAGVRKVPLAFVHYCACVAGKQDLADKFVQVFTSGVPLYDGDPAHALRERMIRSGDARFSVPPRDFIKALTHAFNLFAAREQVQKFQMPTRHKIPMIGLDVEKL